MFSQSLSLPIVGHSLSVTCCSGKGSSTNSPINREQWWVSQRFEQPDWKRLQKNKQVEQSKQDQKTNGAIKRNNWSEQRSIRKNDLKVR